MPPKKGDSQMTLAFLFDTTRILLSMPSDSLPNPPENEDSFRVCRRVETAKEGAFAFSALKASDGTVYKAVGGDPNELLFIQFRSASGDWAPIRVTIPSIEDQPSFVDEGDDGEGGAGVPDEDEVFDDGDEVEKPRSKGKGREVVEID